MSSSVQTRAGVTSQLKKPISRKSTTHSTRSRMESKSPHLEPLQEVECEVVQQQVHSVGLAEKVVREEKAHDVELISLKMGELQSSNTEIFSVDEAVCAIDIKPRRKSIEQPAVEKKKSTVVCDTEIPLDQILSRVFADVSPSSKENERVESPVRRESVSRSGGKYTPDSRQRVARAAISRASPAVRPPTKHVNSSATKKTALPPRPISTKSEKTSGIKSAENKDKVKKDPPVITEPELEQPLKEEKGKESVRKVSGLPSRNSSLKSNGTLNKDKKTENVPKKDTTKRTVTPARTSVKGSIVKR